MDAKVDEIGVGHGEAQFCINSGHDRPGRIVAMVPWPIRNVDQAVAMNRGMPDGAASSYWKTINGGGK
jgi:hypothetical protein